MIHGVVSTVVVGMLGEFGFNLHRISKAAGQNAERDDDHQHDDQRDSGAMRLRGDSHVLTSASNLASATRTEPISARSTGKDSWSAGLVLAWISRLPWVSGLSWKSRLPRLPRRELSGRPLRQGHADLHAAGWIGRQLRE